MGNPTDTYTAPQQPVYTIPASNEMAVQPVAQAAPPAYNNEKAQPVASTVPGQPGQPRNDNLSTVEQQFVNNQPPAMVTPIEGLKYEPAWIDCAFCQRRSITTIKKVESDTTWIYTLLCCLFCGCLCALIPPLAGWACDSEHHCATCGNKVARVPHEGASNVQVQVFAPQPGAPPAQPLPQKPVKGQK